MTCPSAEELAALYDGNLPGARARTVRDHIAFCPRCSRELMLLHQILESVRTAPSPPRKLVDRAKAALHSSGHVVADRSRWKRPAAERRSQHSRK